MDPGDILNRGRDRMVVGFTATYAISVYHHYACEFEPRSWRGNKNDLIIILIDWFLTPTLAVFQPYRVIIITCLSVVTKEYRCGVLDATLCDNVCQWLTADRWISPGNPVSSTLITNMFRNRYFELTSVEYQDGFLSLHSSNETDFNHYFDMTHLFRPVLTYINN
jgi:hypothetical protein